MEAIFIFLMLFSGCYFKKTFVRIKINRTIFLILLANLSNGCSSQSQKESNVNFEKKETTFFINLPKTEENKLRVSEFADTVVYIPLETNSNSLLRRVRQIQIINNHILVNDGNKLLLFSMDGKFVRQIGKKGKGPGEYLIIFDFGVISDTIFISSTGKRSLIKYSINGEFIEEVLTPDRHEMSWFDITPEKNFVEYSGLNSGRLYVFDENLSKVDTVTLDFDAPENPPPFMISDSYDHSFQYGSENKFLFTSYMSDTIWDISNGLKKAAYVLNLGDKILPAEYRIERLQGDTERFLKVAAPYQKIKLVETPSFLFLFQKSWTEGDINSTYIYDVAENTIRKFKTPYIFDDLVGKINLVPCYSSNNCILAAINPFELMEQLKNKSNKAKTGEDTPSPLWIEQMKKINEDDNSILVIMPVRNKTLKK